MTELDKYRPPDYDDPTAGPFSKWAFLTVPQFELSDGNWVAWYPGADWTVSAASKADAITRLRETAMRRSGRYTEDEAICARHLREPIPGIYAMDIGVCNELRETESEEDVNAAFIEAERYRQAGRTYTKADYERHIAGRQRPHHQD